MKENFLSYLVILVFCCQSPPLLSYICFYAHRSIIRNCYLAAVAESDVCDQPSMRKPGIWDFL